MATVRMTTAAILDTAVVAATSASHLINSVGEGAAMLNKSIAYSSWKQDKTITADKKQFVFILQTQKSLELAKANQQLNDYIAQNPEQAEFIKQAMAELSEALA